MKGQRGDREVIGPTVRTPWNPGTWILPPKD